MKATTFVKGQRVIVNARKGRVEGVISSIDTNLCTFETEYSVDYKKDGKTWTMICIPSRALETVND